jgi:hypothetical protein
MKLAAWESDYVFQVQVRDGSMSKNRTCFSMKPEAADDETAAFGGRE